MINRTEILKAANIRRQINNCDHAIKHHQEYKAKLLKRLEEIDKIDIEAPNRH